MNICVSRFILIVGLTVLPLSHAVAEDGQGSLKGKPNLEKTIPDLAWEKRSDWIDVKTDLTPAAKGDGIADDTAAIQGAFDKAVDGMTIYFPPGKYRITETLKFGFPRTDKRLMGSSLIGHGRSTMIVWDGEDKGRMMVSLGAANSRYVGFVWDGRGKAAVGIEHEAYAFETELTHQHEAFLDFTDAGIRIGTSKKAQSAEILYDNCLFERCRRGVALLQFNDYDNTFDGCEFRQCGQGIVTGKANVYVRNCHFEESSICDITLNGEHSHSVRRCTTFGSNRFLEYSAGVATLIVQDCQIDGWRNPEGAISFFGAPRIMMDCVFGSPSGIADEKKPYYAVKNSITNLIQSNNKISGNGTLFDPATLGKPNFGVIYEIPAGKFGGVTKSARQSFLKSKVLIPGKVFDANRDFGAAGDGIKDDTEALQKTINAARAFGKGAIAYLPTGKYVVKETLELTGSDYYFGGSGWLTELLWKGPADLPCIRVHAPERITIENINIGSDSVCGADILQTGTEKPSYVCYDRVWVYGIYQKKPLKQGLRFMNLGKDDIVLIKQVEGNLRFIDSAQATFLANVSYEGSIVVEGKSPDREGILGFQSRLGTTANPALLIKDNHSIVMSDFYCEQTENYIRMEGEESLPPGRVTIQAPKIHLLDKYKDNFLIDIDNYNGELTLGNGQFYTVPKIAKIRSKGDRSMQITIAASFFYLTKPELQLDPATKLSYIGNSGIIEIIEKDKDGKEIRKTAKMKEIEDSSVSDSIPALMRAFDDLRRLGKLDMQLNHPEYEKVPQSSHRMTD